MNTGRNDSTGPAVPKPNAPNAPSPQPHWKSAVITPNVAAAVSRLITAAVTGIGPCRPGGAEHGTSAPRSSVDTLATRYSGRRVDLLGRSLPVPPGTDPADAIRRYLAARWTKSAKALAAKAVVLVDLQNRAGEIAWPAGHPGR